MLTWRDSLWTCPCIPPGNRLEQHKGDRVGQHSIRINDQWRMCFTWTSRAQRMWRSSIITKDSRHE
ncbi:MAG: type II toxin-antitoxin system RelE/ParE family toxin [Steroidobacteraceae bacterium]